jgi:excisionase family DNA binding protein
MLTVSQVADSLNVHPHSVRRWADSGLLNCYRIGFRGDRRFKPEDVNEFLDARVKKG